MTKREISGRYQGSILGVLWSFFNPLVMLAVYSFVFGLVFKAKWAGGETDVDFVVILFSGLILHGLLAECLISAPNLIVGNANYVKKIVFPLESLAWISMLNALFHFLVSLSILALAQLVLVGNLPWTWIFVPFIVAPLIFVCLGVLWLMSSLGVYLRDIGQVTGIISTVLLFLCPIFYPLEVIPEAYRIFIILNPLAILVEAMRSVVIYGEPPNMSLLALYTAVAFCFSQITFLWFQKTKKGFSDVL
jgi:lipopolysaccharide transport system permease protein